MDPETKREFEELRALVKDNHRMLRAIRRDWWYSLIVRIIVWIVVLALPIYLYQQYFAPVLSSLTGTTTPSGGFPSGEELQQALDAYRSLGR